MEYCVRFDGPVTPNTAIQLQRAMEHLYNYPIQLSQFVHPSGGFTNIGPQSFSRIPLNFSTIPQSYSRIGWE